MEKETLYLIQYSEIKAYRKKCLIIVMGQECAKISWKEEIATLLFMDQQALVKPLLCKDNWVGYKRIIVLEK